MASAAVDNPLTNHGPHCESTYCDAFLPQCAAIRLGWLFLLAVSVLFPHTMDHRVFGLKGLAMRFILLVVVFTAIGIGVPLYAWAEEPCRNPDALGVSRTVEVDTAGGALFGSVQYSHAPTFLHDKEVVLTFDDGPFAETTPEVLDALAQECTKATFFYVGKMALRFPGVLAQVDQAGHTIAAHTWAHANLRKLPGARGQAEIEKGLSMLQARLGHPVAAFFRFPYLSDPATSIKYLNGRNIGVFSADVDSWDSHGLTPSSHIVNYVMTRLKQEGHGIVLMHDIKHTTAAALPEILKQLKAGGFKVVHMVAKTPATTLAPFDAWAAKMIQQHDSGVAMAKTDEPVMPDAGDRAPAGKATTVVLAAAVPLAADKPEVKTARPEPATLASVVRLAVAASGAATTVRSATKPDRAKTSEPVVVAVRTPEPVAVAANTTAPPVTAATPPAAADTVRLASLDHKAPIIVPLPTPNVNAVAPAAGPIQASQPPPIIRAPHIPIAPAAIPAPAPVRVAALRSILKPRPAPEAVPAPPPPKKVALLQLPKVEPPVAKPERFKIAKPAPQPDKPVDKPPVVTQRRVIDVVVRKVPRPLRALKVTPAWVASNNSIGSNFTALPLSKR